MSTQMKAPGPTTQQLLLEIASFERKILQEILRTLLCFMGLTQIIKYIVFWTFQNLGKVSLFFSRPKVNQ